MISGAKTTDSSMVPPHESIIGMDEVIRLREWGHRPDPRTAAATGSGLAHWKLPRVPAATGR